MCFSDRSRRFAETEDVNEETLPTQSSLFIAKLTVYTRSTDGGHPLSVGVVERLAARLDVGRDRRQGCTAANLFVCAFSFLGKSLLLEPKLELSDLVAFT